MSVDISIIIPLFNKEKYVERVMTCIERQTFRNWECIIIDDGSTDGSQGIVENFIANKGDQWLYIRQANQGQAVARNRGIELAKGKYIAFLDSDDLWPTGKLLAQFLAIEKNPLASLVLSAYAIFNDGSSIPKVVRHDSAERMLKGCLSLHGFGTGLESVGLVKKSILHNGIRFDTNLSTSSGLDFAIQLWAVGEIIFVRDIGLFYRISDGQWHSDSGELSRNLSILREKYEGSFGLNLTREHEEYFYWLRQRELGLKIFLFSIFKSLFRPGNMRFEMLSSLILRFIVVRLRGFMMRKKIWGQLQELN